MPDDVSMETSSTTAWELALPQSQLAEAFAFVQGLIPKGCQELGTGYVLQS